jgi:hypothetical protein
MARTKRSSLDSVATLAKLHVTPRPTWPDVVPLPQCEKRRADVLIRFDSFLSYRSSDDWSASDLLLLCKLARVAALHDQALDILERESLSQLAGRRGDTPVKHPMVEASQSLSSQMLSVMRSLRLFNDADPRSLALHGRKAREVEGQNQARAKSGLESLLA